MPMTRIAIPTILGAALAATTACSEGKAALKPVARVDTLPSGRVVVTSSEPTGWATPAEAWKVTPAGMVGGADGTAAELSQPSTIAIDPAGRVYVADRKPPVVKVFDSSGALVRVIGREGSGPGEFRVTFIAVRGSTLVVHDPMQSRTSVFDTAGTYVRSWKSSCCYWNDIYIDREMRIYIPSMPPTDSAGKPKGRAYLRYTVDGQPIDTLLFPDRAGAVKTWQVQNKAKTSMMSTGVPFTPRMEAAFHPLGGFVYGWSGDYRLVRSAAGGADSSRIISRAWTPDVIPDSAREAATNEALKWIIEQFGETIAREAVKLSDVPTSAPAFSTLRVDEDEQLWARRVMGNDSSKTIYDVFRADGSWLGAVTVPALIEEYGGQLFAKGYIYAVVEDEDGRPRVARFRIDR